MFTRSLLETACGGNRAAQGRLLERFDSLLRKEIRKFVGADSFRTNGDDLLQMIRLRIIEHLGSCRSRTRGGFAQWCRTLIKHQLVDWIRKEKSGRRNPGYPVASLNATDAPTPPPAKGTTPSEKLLRQEDLRRLERAIDLVPEQYRAVLKFIHKKVRMPDEVAAFLEKSPGAARQFVSRAIRRLRKTLETLPDEKTHVRQ